MSQRVQKHFSLRLFSNVIRGAAGLVKTHNQLAIKAVTCNVTSVQNKLTLTLSIRFHSGRSVYCVAEQTVTRHSVTDHARNDWT